MLDVLAKDRLDCRASRSHPSVSPSSRRLPCLFGAETRGSVGRSCGAHPALPGLGMRREARISNQRSDIREGDGRGQRTVEDGPVFVGLRLPRDG